MATRLNPAWQRRAVSSDHLAKVSDHLRSEGSQQGRAVDGCQVIPFLLDNSAQDWITRDLCEVLIRRGQRSRLCDVQMATGDNMAQELATQLHEQAADDELCLLSTTSAEAIQSCDFDHVVLLVPASLEAILQAYRRIKLLSIRKTPDIGIVIEGPRDQHAAWRYFRKLAVGTLRYLDTPLLNLGFLPQQVLPEHGPDDHHRHNFLTRISERLLCSEFHSRYRTGTAEPGALSR